MKVNIPATGETLTLSEDFEFFLGYNVVNVLLFNRLYPQEYEILNSLTDGYPHKIEKLLLCKNELEREYNIVFFVKEDEYQQFISLSAGLTTTFKKGISLGIKKITIRNDRFEDSVVNLEIVGGEFNDYSFYVNLSDFNKIVYD